MRRFIITLFAGVVLAGGGIAITGCTDETGTKQETKITGPGGTTTEKTDKTINKSGENPPLAPSEKKIP